ncbi:AcrR family transcriptional regulator [Thermocatellispora tengchongensis]|uniref:AcrR family transcriptional regulator n=1 Tax=Thermocatellispora tengchongensis TaxID=1073253 RepID=A0A840P827_9ACTN|nr:TetR/AcrR family transcriptional regulator [Thermocatellispora tengchongensis]MBB5132165.1 AcrR family transcriptional regulator [Thermocatellispora tengchongensis]
MARPSDTKARILAVARELFAEKGVQQTSLRDISERLGITKPALYYHFASREELLRSVVQPLVDEVEAFLAEMEAAGRPDPELLLRRYFEVTYRHRDIIGIVVRELSILDHLDLPGRMFAWRLRLIELLLGPEAGLGARARAVVAIGGLSDCTVAFPGVPAEELGPPAVAAALDALGLP